MESFFKQSVKEIRNNIRGKQWRINNQIPFMRYRELDIFKEIIDCVNPKNILEWGSGYSTLFFPDMVPELKEWKSIEHNKQWFEEIQALNKNSKVKIVLKEPNQHPYTDEHGDGAYDDFKDYIEVAGNSKQFDLIFVDGRARNDCLIKAKRVLNDGGVVILHDANRKRYKKNMHHFPFSQIFFDYRRTAGGLWLGSISKPIHEMLEVRKHQKRWGFVNNKVAKVLSV